MPSLPPALVAECREVLAQHAKTFRFAALFLPTEARDEAAVLYAFCRLVDDLADEAPDRAQAHAALGQLSEELEGRAPPRPLVAATRDILEARGVGIGPAQQLMIGVLSDLDEVLVADDAELLRYCYRVAGTVGLMMTGVLGVQERAALPHALDLGVGMQLTNICRDVLEDAGRGRVYLPASRLEAEGVSQAALLAGRADPESVARVVRALLQMAESYYASADQGMRYIPLRRRLAILVAGRVYRAIGLKLLRRGGDALAGRVYVPLVGKLAWAARALAVGARLALSDARPHDAALHRALIDLPGAHAAA
ncbi:MAG: phytoene/squalene synthase family protein [Alphaproteobacteria bacterium]|nr:phytoene/squalene synthase family protein [Alphaproteobacteria bacterium]